MPSIVQFCHPGAEHGPDHKNGNWKSWNTKSHRRKFLRSDGKYIDSDDIERIGKLQFWGEWEPPSKVAEFPNRPDVSFPQWVHEPILPVPIPRPGQMTGYQNTDPFVFGDHFHYFVCKQYIGKTGATTSLSRLDKGSLILFGSTHGINASNAYFQLDTVFVVGDYVDYDVSDPNALTAVPGLETYRQIVYKMAFPSPLQKSLRLRLYTGATPENPFSGMYSFSPARVVIDDTCGFPRAILSNMPFLTNNLNASPRSSFVTLPDVISNWKLVRGKTRQQGFLEGFNFQYQTQSCTSKHISSNDHRDEVNPCLPKC
jgi:hypothetical protein